MQRNMKAKALAGFRNLIYKYDKQILSFNYKGNHSLVIYGRLVG